MDEMLRELLEAKRPQRGRPSAQVAELLLRVRQLQAVLDAVPEGLEVVDRHGEVVFVNAAFSRVAGVPAEQRLGLNILQVVPEGELAQVLRDGRPIRSRPARAHGSGVEVVASAHPLSGDSEMIGAVLVVQDVSEVLRLNRDLQRSAALVDDLVRQVGDLTRADYTFTDIAGESPALGAAINLARRAADSDSTILLEGESGTGKELFAHAIHNGSRRRSRPFIKVNCAAVPDHLLESEFFGYEKGAFTGAVRRKLGMFQLAEGGSIFLDEIGDMSLPLQAKLLRVLQEREFTPLGATQPARVNVRVIAATNVCLPEQVAAGKFRADLYHRLNVVAVHVPPLRERREDLPTLVERILRRLGQRLGRSVEGVSEAAMALLVGYHWPGNVREVENVLERSLHMMAPGATVLDVDAFKGLQSPGTRDPQRLAIEVMPLAEVEREMITRAIQKFGNTGEGKRRAAVALGISLATLYNKIKVYEFES